MLILTARIHILIVFSLIWMHTLMSYMIMHNIWMVTLPPFSLEFHPRLPRVLHLLLRNLTARLECLLFVYFGLVFYVTQLFFFFHCGLNVLTF